MGAVASDPVPEDAFWHVAICAAHPKGAPAAGDIEIRVRKAGTIFATSPLYVVASSRIGNGASSAGYGDGMFFPSHRCFDVPPGHIFEAVFSNTEPLDFQLHALYFIHALEDRA